MTSCKPPPTCIDASPIPDANDSRMSAIPYEANLTPMRLIPLSVTAAINPVPQRRQPDPEIGSHLTSGATTRPREPHSLVAELGGEALLRVWHRGPPPSRKELSTFPTQVQSARSGVRIRAALPRASGMRGAATVRLAHE